jgi:hypothetical protein
MVTCVTANDAVAIILALYPVFTLTTNFPLICITLRNNIIRFVPERGISLASNQPAHHHSITSSPLWRLFSAGSDS